MIRETLHKIEFLILACMIFSSISAQDDDMVWFRICTQDFGGNEVDDPANPSKNQNTLLPEQVGEDLRFTNTQGAGCYYLTKQSTTNPKWHTGGDHTHLGDVTRGYYMRVDPNSIDKTEHPDVDQMIIYVQKIEGLCKGVTFKFTAYLANLSIAANSHDPHLALGIYKDKETCKKSAALSYKDITLDMASESEMSSASLPWREITMIFKLEEDVDYAYFVVSAVDPETEGFDHAIDDISVDVQHPAVHITNDRDFEYHYPVKLTCDFQNNGFFPSMTSLKYQWYYSKDSIEAFQPISGATGTYLSNTTFSYTIPSFDKDVDNGYYRVVIGEEGNFGSPVCSIQGDIKIAETKNKKHVHLCHNSVVTEADGVELNAATLSDGQEVSGSNGMVYIISKTTPTTKQGEDKYICIGGVYNGVQYNEETSFPINDTIKSKVYPDCDSLYVLKTLYVTTPKEIPLEDQHICQGETYKDKVYSTPTTEVLKFDDENGCMTYIQNVIVHETYNYSKEYTICAGSDFRGETFTYGGDFTRTYNYNSVFGCDSIENATIHVTDKVIEELEPVYLCEGESYVHEGTVYKNPGVYELSSLSTSKVSGCDSITKFKLVINAKYDNRLHPIDTVICFGSPLFDSIYEVPTVRPDTVRDPRTFKTVNGCDSIVYYSLTVLRVELRLKVKSNRNTICGGEQVEIDVANLKPADALLSWSHTFHGTERKALFTPTEDMTYVVLARNEKAGCEATDTVRIYVKDTPYLTIDSVDQRDNIVQYHTEGGTAPYSVILDKKEIDAPETGELENSFIGMHTLSVKDSTGCVSSQQFEIIPIPITPAEFFSPNGDGVFDVWTIENIDLYAKARVRIFSRDGRLLREFNGSDEDAFWDGTYMGHLMPATDYWYEINLPEIDRQYLGHFTLIHEQ